MKAPSSNTICTAPIGKNIINFDSKLILNALEINNEFNLVLFDVKLPTRISKDVTINIPTFAITDACGSIQIFGIGTRKQISSALARVERSAVGLANKILKY
jgi:hypothetical protein